MSDHAKDKQRNSTVSFSVSAETKKMLQSIPVYTQWIANLVELNLGFCPVCRSDLRKTKTKGAQMTTETKKETESPIETLDVERNADGTISRIAHATEAAYEQLEKDRKNPISHSEAQFEIGDESQYSPKSEI